MNTKHKSCTILGANGFIGRHLTYFLHHAGYKVFAYDIQANPNSNIPKEVDYQSFDICNNYTHIQLDVDYLFIFSGMTGTKNGFDQYKTFIEVNEIGLLNILSLVKNLEKKPIIIFPSTRLVYQGMDTPLKEEAAKEAKTIYAVNKIAAEQYFKIYAQCFNIQYIIYRICVPYGNMFDDQFSYGTIDAFLNRAKAGEDITLYGDGEIERTFTHVSSICEQIYHTMSSKNAKNQIFNIAGERFSLKEAACKIADIYHTQVRYVPWNDLDLAIESGSTVFDGTKIESLITSQIKNYSFDEWLKEIAK
ncbi:MAG TPA: SDR family oxidoreductase [Bacteroidales bacterium]|nr:SDR family oxidoreductase [Bacteroidales bacterium]HPS72176.1 SDR family oxidoreductase [Bacteroidales bacterium]